MISGGGVPGGIVLRRVWLMAVTSASADPMFASGWKKTRIRPTPASDCDSMCSMLLTVVVIARSEMVTMRPSTSFGESPLNCQMIEMTGMLISGKMSTGVRAMVSTPPMAISSAITMNVYGRRSARRTIHIAQPTAPLSSCMPPGRRNSHAGGVRSLPLLDSSRFRASAPKLAGLVPRRPCRHLGTRAEMSAASRRVERRTGRGITQLGDGGGCHRAIGAPSRIADAGRSHDSTLVRDQGHPHLVSRTRSPLPKSGVDRRRWQGATTRNSWRYSEEEQRSQRRRAAPEFGHGLRVRDTRSAVGSPKSGGLRTRIDFAPWDSHGGHDDTIHAARPALRLRRARTALLRPA